MRLARFSNYLCLTMLSAAMAMAGPVRADVAATLHFAGMSEMVTRTNLKTLHKALTVSSSQPVRRLIVMRAAMVLATNFGLPTNAAATLAPLVDDAFAVESVGSLGDATGGRVDAVLALRLNTARAQAWRAALTAAFGKEGEKFQAEGFDGVQWRAGASNLFWIVPARDWLLAGWGLGLEATRSDYLDKIKTSGRPAPPLTDHWLETDFDLTRLGGALPDTARLFKPGQVHLTVGEDAGSVVATASVKYANAIPWRAVDGKTPKELVPSRFNSFTAGHDIQAYLDLDPAFSKLDGNPLTNSFYLWSLGGMPFLTYGAASQANASNTLTHLAAEATNAFNSWLKQFNGTELVWRTDVHKLVLSNLRVIFPTLEDVEDKTGEFLVMNLFQRMPATQPALKSLWDEAAGRTNLVYYDWEQTGSRLQDWRMLGRMLLFRQPHMVGEEMVASTHDEDMWLTDLIPAWDGNAVTEVTRVSPTELAIVRRSPVGLTGIEIFLLCDWLTSLGLPP